MPPKPMSTVSEGPLRLVVALSCEARPLVDHWKLKSLPEHEAFKVFSNGDVALVVSGVGKAASAAATAYLHLASGAEPWAVWLNVGIAGSSRPVGSNIVAHKVRDRATGEAWYPPQVVDAPGSRGDDAVAQVVTVDTVESRYAGNAVYEMEASGFYPTACRFVTAELVQVFKVVSDSPGEGVEMLDARRITELVAAHVAAVDGFAGRLRELARAARVGQALPEPLREIQETLLEQRHFTSTQRHQLRRELERWNALVPDEALPAEELLALKRGKDVLGWLRERLATLRPAVG